MTRKRWVLEKPADVAHGAQLHREPQAVRIAATTRDSALVIVAEAKAARELVGRELARELSVVVLRARGGARRAGTAARGRAIKRAKSNA